MDTYGRANQASFGTLIDLISFVRLKCSILVGKKPVETKAEEGGEGSKDDVDQLWDWKGGSKESLESSCGEEVKQLKQEECDSDVNQKSVAPESVTTSPHKLENSKQDPVAPVPTTGPKEPNPGSESGCGETTKPVLAAEGPDLKEISESASTKADVSLEANPTQKDNFPTTPEVPVVSEDEGLKSDEDKQKQRQAFKDRQFSFSMQACGMHVKLRYHILAGPRASVRLGTHD